LKAQESTVKEIKRLYVKITFQFQGNIQSFMRQCGYFFEREQNKELVFSRIISTAKSGYPRFHAYVKTGKFPRETSINLHLDRKKPVYQGTPAHSAEYGSEIVKKEAERIKEKLLH
jgi:hypothetical protein